MKKLLLHFMANLISPLRYFTAKIKQKVLPHSNWTHKVNRRTFKKLKGHFKDEKLPWLDRENTPNPDLLSNASKLWRRNGFLIVKNLIEHELLDEYCQDWILHNRINNSRPGGYPGPTPHDHVDSLLRIGTHQKIREITKHLIGEEMGLHLCLTGWKSTERNWHQDGYLNPDENFDHYVAAWVALDDIHPDSGPFEFIPGSHKLPRITQNKAKNHLQPHERDSDLWPTYSERFLTPLFESLRATHNLQSQRFLAKKGDVLFWHSRLMHRGSAPKNIDLDRKTAILHYSGIHHRPDFDRSNFTKKQYADQGWYWEFNQNDSF